MGAALADGGTKAQSLCYDDVEPCTGSLHAHHVTACCPAPPSVGTRPPGLFTLPSSLAFFSERTRSNDGPESCPTLPQERLHIRPNNALDSAPRTIDPVLVSTESYQLVPFRPAPSAPLRIPAEFLLSLQLRSHVVQAASVHALMLENGRPPAALVNLVVISFSFPSGLLLYLHDRSLQGSPHAAANARNTITCAALVPRQVRGLIARFRDPLRTRELSRSQTRNRGFERAPYPTIPYPPLPF